MSNSSEDALWNASDDACTADFEVVGLEESSNGRSCCVHECCGSSVVPGSLVRVRLVRVVGMINVLVCVMFVIIIHAPVLGVVSDVDGKSREALACYLIWDGTESCRVGFLPRASVRVKDRFHGKFGQVCELYGDSDNSQRRRKSHRNRGMASCAFIDQIPLFE